MKDNTYLKTTPEMVIVMCSGMQHIFALSIKRQSVHKQIMQLDDENISA